MRFFFFFHLSDNQRHKKFAIPSRWARGTVFSIPSENVDRQAPRLGACPLGSASRRGTEAQVRRGVRENARGGTPSPATVFETTRMPVDRDLVQQIVADGNRAIRSSGWNGRGSSFTRRCGEIPEAAATHSLPCACTCPECLRNRAP